MAKTQKILLCLCALSVVASARAEPQKERLILDFRMGNALFLQPNDAKRNEALKTDLAKPAMALSKSKRQTKDESKAEIKDKKMIVTGSPGDYSLGYYVFYDEEHIEKFFPHLQKSIYSLCEVSDESKPTVTIGDDLMLAGFKPDVLNAPWEKVADFTTRTSTVITVPLKTGLNYLSFKLDPSNKISEAERIIDAKTGAEISPWMSLEENNNASYVVELVAPKKSFPIPDPNPIPKK